MSARDSQAGRPTWSLSPQDLTVSYGQAQFMSSRGRGQRVRLVRAARPLAPIAPKEVAGRQFDFPSGYNIAIGPRAFEPITFHDLRALAETYDLLRLVIETRKDQIERMSWSLRPRPGSDGPGAARIKELTRFFHKPDGEHCFAAWLRMLLEDLLVIDAPTLWKQRARNGSLLALHPLDGATIKRVIDDWGRTPQAFVGEDGALVYPAAYQQVLKGYPAVDYAARDLIYAPRNLRPGRVYGFSPVEQIVMTANIALKRQIFTLTHFTEGNIPESLIGVPESWTPDQIKNFQDYWDAYFTGDLAARRRAKFVPGGVAKTFIQTKEPELKNLFDEWLARVVCYAFSVSPQAFVHQHNRATGETQKELAEEEGLWPILKWVKRLIDRVLLEDFGEEDVEFVWGEDAQVDASQQAQVLTSYVAAGILTRNEARAQLGQAPVAERCRRCAAGDDGERAGAVATAYDRRRGPRLEPATRRPAHSHSRLASRGSFLWEQPRMAEFNLFIPLTKADAKRRLVYGVVTAEAPDRGNEICDYATTKPYYQKWSAEFLKASGGKSLGNLRAMHGKIAAGRLEAINFNDDEKQIEICAKIVDDAEWRKVEAGVYTGFSQGGGYVRRWPDANDPSLTRYTANPSEISLVDLPALPNATFSLIKARRRRRDAALRHARSASEVEQVWMAQDGKTFKKKAEALAHQMALASMGPMLGALARAESDVDDVRQASRKRPEREKLAKLLSEQALDAARAVAALEIVFDILNNALDDETDAADEISALAEAIDELKQFIASFLLAAGRAAGAERARRKDLAKALEETQLERDAQRALLEELTPRLEKLAARVEEIGRQPLPPPLLAGTRAIEKGAEMQQDDLAAALAKMSSEERAALLIKVAQRQPASRFAESSRSIRACRRGRRFLTPQEQIKMNIHATTHEVLQAIRKAQSASLTDPRLGGLEKSTFQQPISATSGLNFYDLEPGAKFLVPVLTPLRNETPRVSGMGGIQANWRAITGINTTGLRLGVSGGNRAGVQAVTTTDYYASYKGIGLETSVDFEAEYAGMGFDDVRAQAGLRGLQATMIGEEALILGGNSSMPLGVTPTPTLTASSSGGGLASRNLVRHLRRAVARRRHQRLGRHWNSRADHARQRRRLVGQLRRRRGSEIRQRHRFGHRPDGARHGNRRGRARRAGLRLVLGRDRIGGSRRHHDDQLHRDFRDGGRNADRRLAYRPTSRRTRWSSTGF